MIWYCGQYVGLDFNYSPPKALTNGSIISNGGNATICNSNGQLLFYTDGITVYNAQHKVLKNGTGLKGGAKGMAVLIAPNPASIFQYYIFTVGDVAPLTYQKLCYNLVDMRSDSGRGEVIIKNIVLQDSVLPKFAIVRHSNKKSIWLVVHKTYSNAFAALEINSAGINKPVFSCTGFKGFLRNITLLPSAAQWGYYKFSPDGKLLATTNTDSCLEVFKFNNSTGSITLWWGLYDKKRYYGVEFSEDISKLYVTTDGLPDNSTLYQFNLNLVNTTLIKSSRTVIYTNPNIGFGVCQMGRDKKIYIPSSVSGNLCAIKEPNKLGSNCQFLMDYVYFTFPYLMTRGLPNYLSDYYFFPEMNVKNECLKDSTWFELSDTTKLDSVSWNFDDPVSSLFNFSKLKKPYHIFTDTGIYNVTAIVHKDSLLDTIRRQIVISEYPHADFSFLDTAHCFKGNLFSFKDTSSISTGTYSAEWNFGDSTSDYSKYPKHSYLKAGIYTVGLTALSDHGCSNTKTKRIYVYPNPSAASTVNDSNQCLAGNNFKFNNNQLTPACKYNWSFGDGKSDTSHNAAHSYAIADSFTVKLICTTINNCYDTFYTKVITRPSPLARFVVNDSIQCLKSNHFVFINTGAFNSSGGLWNWTYGDSGSDTVQNTMHDYLINNHFMVKLNVINSFNCKDSAFKSITVNPSPKADYMINDSIQCLKGNHFVFGNTGTFNSTTGKWLWDFGDISGDTSKNTIHSYGSSGTFTISLISNNQYFCTDTFKKKIVVHPSPLAQFKTNRNVQCLNQNDFTFKNTGSFNSPSGNWNWNLGDGTILFSQNADHQFSKADTFSIKLKASNSYGCSDSMMHDVIVFPSPNSSFSVNDSIQCLAGNSFSFQCLNSTDNYLWNFGDATFGTNKAENHNYLTAAFYSVRLIVKTINNCTDTSNQNIEVKPNPVSPLISSNSPLCEGDSLKMDAVSSANCIYSWTATNGYSSHIKSPVIEDVEIKDSGEYFVKAILDGCESSITKTSVAIYPKPSFSFGTEKTICSGEFIILDPGYFKEYLWQDSSTSRTYKVTQAGNYHLVVKNAFGCSYAGSIDIKEHCPTALFIPNSFTPNNDGLNDYFHIVGENITDFKLIIYNRWGQKVFESNSLDYEWDGKCNGIICQPNVYYFQVIAKGNNGFVKNVSGTITLVR